MAITPDPTTRVLAQQPTDSASLVPEPPEPQTFAGQLKSLAGLLALIAGLITLVLILLIANSANITGDQFTQLATAAIGVVGAGVGAYFGVKVGSDGTAKAVQGQREEAAHAQVFAAHLDPANAPLALHNAFPHAIPAPPEATTTSRPGSPLGR